jgi:hypothetical protein
MGREEILFERFKANLVDIGENIKGKNRDELAKFLIQEEGEKEGFYSYYKKIILGYNTNIEEAVKERFITEEERAELSKIVFDKYNTIFRNASDDIKFMTRDLYIENKVMGAFYVIDKIIERPAQVEQKLPKKEKTEDIHKRIALGIKSDEDKLNKIKGEYLHQTMISSVRDMILYLETREVPFAKDTVNKLKKLLDRVSKAETEKKITKIFDDNDKLLYEEIVKEFDEFYAAYNKETK